MEQFSTPERNIKIEELDIKTEFHDEETLSNESDTQFNAVIFGTAKYKTQNTDEIFENDINEDVKNDTLVSLDTRNIPTVQKRKKNRVKSLEDINIKNEKSFYSKTPEDNIFKNKFQYSFNHDIVVKNEIDFTEQFLMDTEMNYEKEVLAENVVNEVVSKELNFTCKKRKTKKENHKDNFSYRKENKNNTEIGFKETILPEDETILENNYNNKKEEIHSKIQENLKTRKEIPTKIQENLEMPLLIPIDKKKTYICNDCGHNSNYLGNLKRHIKRLHTPTQNKNKPQAFSCTNCAFKCSKKSTLEKHNKKHKEKPFSCQLCDYKTRHKNGLNRHLKTHTGEKQFTCEICNRKCTTKRGLEFHIMIHSGKKPYSCDKCDFKAVNKHDITRHARIHTGEKPFSCEICGYACIRKYHLSLHMRKLVRERDI